MLKKEFDFILQEGIQYSENGAFPIAKKLTLKAPSNKQRKIVSKLQQGLIQALMSTTKYSNQNKEIKKDKTSLDGGFTADVVLMLLQASDIDISSYMENFKELLTSNICLVDGKLPLNSQQYDELSIEEGDRLLGEYIINFLLPAGMKAEK